MKPHVVRRLLKDARHAIWEEHQAMSAPEHPRSTMLEQLLGRLDKAIARFGDQIADEGGTPTADGILVMLWTKLRDAKANLALITTPLPYAEPEEPASVTKERFMTLGRIDALNNAIAELRDEMYSAEDIHDLGEDQ